MQSRPFGELVDRGELTGELWQPHLAHADREEQVDLLGVGGDRRGEGGRVDAERVSRRQQHVVEAGAVGGPDDVGTVLPAARERRVGNAEELVVVVAQRAEPRDLGNVGSIGDAAHGRGTPSDAWMMA